ncbi:hypothetical protein [Streptomyces sp. V3I7]|uniref:hypothetical protein n=1 Tax=Streptomyces sp. V3I7 TaxID=3042278 RepID=UPI00277E6B57|nr:hypothetical protein [Streptomyces sp. V3I7]MDQ0992154.1 hypothetical protein [Streptomyces sp. V3I7]
MSAPRGTPPSDWPGLEMVGMTRLTDEIYYGWLAHETNPTFWHWCPKMAALPEERTVHRPWVAAGTSAHTLVAREPLHLEPSLLWQCCGTHGFVRNGAWIPA